MDLKSGYPFWAVKNGLMKPFPPLMQDVRCEIAVVGGGITGAILAEELARHGHDVVVIEQRDIGWGSTSASTGLLQYEIDTHLVDLVERYGEDNALLAYRACAEAIPAITALARSTRDVGFERAESLYYASRLGHRHALRAEFELRRKHGFDVDWLEAPALRRTYGIDAPAAILSRLAARIDPYRMAHRLLDRLRSRGVGVYDRTTVCEIAARSRSVAIRTENGPIVRAEHMVLAAGYASQQWLAKRVARNRSSYAYVTDPIEDEALGALKRTLFWESARPYLYFRATSDGRLMIGGEDDRIDVPARRDARVNRKAEKLFRRMRKLFPHVPLAPTFSWGGTFAETADGLPFFSPHPQHGKRVLFAMAYGGNGIVYSMAGAGLLRALIERRRHPLARLFSFERQS